MPSASASSSSKHKRSRTSSSATSKRSQQLEKTEISINVYDLLPPGRLSTVLWTLGGSLLHSGTVIRGREYAYGGHNRRNVTGVYYTKPQFEPPGGTFRCNILQGFSFASPSEIEGIVKAVSEEFLGTRYNLLTNNCNHFTSALCERLTGRAAPGWVNRAASIGLALPCVVPKEWIAPPDHETAEGELLEEEEDEEDSEGAPMMGSEQRRQQREAQAGGRVGESGSLVEVGDESEDEGAGSSLAGGRRLFAKDETPPPRLVAVKDSSGREMPVAERAPVPRTR